MALHDIMKSRWSTISVQTQKEMNLAGKISVSKSCNLLFNQIFFVTTTIICSSCKAISSPTVKYLGTYLFIISNGLNLLTQLAAKMMSNLNADILSTILVFVAISSNGATDVARMMTTCKNFMTAAKDLRVLKAMNWSNVRVVEGHGHLFYHINGLLSQSAELGNETAQYVLSKAVLLGSTPLWSRMLENDMVQAYINNQIIHTPEAKKEVIEILKEEAIREMPCISNVFYGNRHHTILVRLFISQCDSDDIIQMCQHLQSYAQFFKGFEAVVRAEFFSSITKMCEFGYELNEENPLRHITEDIMSDSGSSEPNSISLWVLLAPEKVFEKRREQALYDFNILFPPPVSST